MKYEATMKLRKSHKYEKFRNKYCYDANISQTKVSDDNNENRMSAGIERVLRKVL